MEKREFNLRERAEIVGLAIIAAETYKAQDLINYFEKKYVVIEETATEKESDEELAWYLYCAETVGSTSARDFWEELPNELQLHYLNKIKKLKDDRP